jgi:DNA polymerase-3 subunit delta
MSNIYVLIGNDTYMIEEEKKKLISSYGIDDFNISSYDFLTSEPLEIINEMMTISLFGEKRLVVINDADFLKSTYKKEHIVEKFIEYFNNENPDTVLLLVTNNDLDYRGKIGSILKSKAQIIKVSALEGNDLNTWINNKISSCGYKIDPTATQELISRCEGDLLQISNELEKLMLYHDDKDITYNSVKLLVSRNLEDNIFNLLNAFVANDKKTLFSIYEDFMTLNEDEMRIISAISNKLEEILLTKVLIKRRCSKEDIATYFKVKPGRAYYMMEAAKKISESTIESLVNRITELDYNIKSGKIDKKLGLQLFILGA